MRLRGDPAALRRRMLALPVPGSSPAGPLERVAWAALHRAVPFDRELQARITDEWGLTAVNCADRSHLGARRAGAYFQLRRLVSSCPEPACLLAARDLLRDAPWLTEDGYAHALRLAGLSTGPAGLELVLALSALWRDGDPAVADPVEHLHGLAEVADLGARVRTQGAVSVRRPPGAVTSRFLRHEHGIVWRAGYAVAGGDWTSALARPVRRQLEAIGPLTAAELRRGLVRAVPALAQLDATGVLAWVGAQDDLHADDDVVRLEQDRSGDGRSWLKLSDRAVLDMIATSADAAQVQRADIMAALVTSGYTSGSAHVFIVRCPWLRHAGARGLYRLPPAARAAARAGKPA